MKIFVNVLTILRIIATFCLPIVWNYASSLVLVLFVIATLLTDFFDGKLARIFKVQTLFGSLADVVADKLFGLIIIFIVAHYYSAFYIMFAMELIIALINVIAALKGATTISSFLGKCKMWLLGFAIISALIAIYQDNLLNVSFLNKFMTYFIEHEDNLISMFVYLAVGSEIMVAVDYLSKINKELKRNKKKLNYKKIKYDFKEDKDLLYALFNTDYYLKHKKDPLSKLLLK